MKLYKTLLTAAIAAAVASPALAVELEKPEAYGFLSAGGLKIEGQDAGAEAFELEVGLQGKAVLDEKLNLHYAVEVDFAPAANADDDGGPGGESDVHLKEAKFWLPTQYGLFVVAPRGTTGYWVELYGPINHYEYNEPRGTMVPDRIFSQPDRTSGTLAYHTPWFMNTKLVVAAITLKEDNGENADGRSARLVYKGDSLQMGIGTAVLKRAQLPPFTTDDYQISAASIGYTIGGVNLGALYETNRKQPYPSAPDGNADSDSWGVSASWVSDRGTGVALGYKEKDHDFDVEDDSAYTLKVEQRLTSQVKVWAETGQYDESPSNYAVGLNVTF